MIGIAAVVKEIVLTVILFTHWLALSIDDSMLVCYHFAILLVVADFALKRTGCEVVGVTLIGAVKSQVIVDGVVLVCSKGVEDCCDAVAVCAAQLTLVVNHRSASRTRVHVPQDVALTFISFLTSGCSAMVTSIVHLAHLVSMTLVSMTQHAVRECVGAATVRT